ncbi:hypothetical protein DFH27DRAFT_527142 [Peziza echinospora]|nr:hypothetical protein DFH27DRAFT_527142 [Peziza echinospora]
MTKGARSTAHVFPPTPINSSPPTASRRSASQPPPPAPSPSAARADPHHGCKQAVRFLQRRASGADTGYESFLRIEDPCKHLLCSLQRARRQASGEAEEQEEEGEECGETDGCPENLFAGIPASAFRSLRLRHIVNATPPVLVLRPMVSALHNCIHHFVFQHLLAPPPKNPHGFCQNGLLTDAEMADLVVEFASPVDVPGGPADKGYNDPSPFEDRRKTRAMAKEPDVSFFHSAGLAAQTQRRTQAQMEAGDSDSSDDDGDANDDDEEASDDDEDANDDDEDANDDDDPDSAMSVGEEEEEEDMLVYPCIIMEVAYSERYADLLADCLDYLLSSRGAIRLAILVKIAYSRPAAQGREPRPAPTAGDASSPPTWPDSGPSDYRAVAKLIEWVAPCGAAGGAGDIRMRGERIHVLRGGKIPARSKTRAPPTAAAAAVAASPQRKRKRGAKHNAHRGPRILPIGLRREDFGLDAAGAVDPATQQETQPPLPPPGPLVMVDVAAYAEILQQASKRVELRRRVGERKKRRAAVRVSRGDVGGEWRPTYGDDIYSMDFPYRDRDIRPSTDSRFDPNSIEQTHLPWSSLRCSDTFPRAVHACPSAVLPSIHDSIKHEAHERESRPYLIFSSPTWMVQGEGEWLRGIVGTWRFGYRNIVVGIEGCLLFPMMCARVAAFHAMQATIPVFMNAVSMHAWLSDYMWLAFLCQLLFIHPLHEECNLLGDCLR